MACIKRVIVAGTSTFFMGGPGSDLGGPPAFRVFKNCKFQKPKVRGFCISLTRRVHAYFHFIEYNAAACGIPVSHCATILSGKPQALSAHSFTGKGFITFEINSNNYNHLGTSSL